MTKRPSNTEIRDGLAGRGIVGKSADLLPGRAVPALVWITRINARFEYVGGKDVKPTTYQ